jgi:N-acyl-D-amino-acid deacylase
MRSRVAASVIVAVVAGACARPDALPYDVLITDARVLDGTGAPWYRADVAVLGGRIAAIGRLGDRAARIRINGLNRVVAPGFIDMMGGSSLPLYRDPVSANSKITQGITTMLVGEGASLAPQNERTIAAAGPGLDTVITWRTFGEYFRLLEARGIALNVVHNVGAAQVRMAVIGEEGREPTPAELDSMRALVRQAMEDGAVGLSTALIYPPGAYASTAELIELATVAAQYGGVYFSHMRNESGQLLQAIAEVARIAQAAGLPGHIYHLKAAGQEHWPLMPRALDLIARVRAQGVDLTADIYPYVRNGIGLGSFLHPRHYAAGEDAFIATLSDPAVRAELRREIETTSDWENWYQHVGRNWDRVLITAVRADAGGSQRAAGGASAGQERVGCVLRSRAARRRERGPGEHERSAEGAGHARALCHVRHGRGAHQSRGCGQRPSPGVRDIPPHLGQVRARRLGAHPGGRDSAHDRPARQPAGAARSRPDR